MTHRSPNHPANQKRLLRVQAAEARRAAFAALGEQGGEKLRAAFAAAVPVTPGMTVAGYWPIGDEADVVPLLRWVEGQGGIVCLPVVVAKNHPLGFRRWTPGEELERGPHGTRHPFATAPAVMPDVIVVPLLAFDRRGYRLGYGGGYYDRTLERLRSYRKVTAVGLAFAAQEVAAVPHDRHDELLDWIVTEEGAVAIERTVG